LHGPRIHKETRPASGRLVFGNQESIQCSDLFRGACAEHSRRRQQSAAKRHWPASDAAYGGHHHLPRMTAFTLSVPDHNPFLAWRTTASKILVSMATLFRGSIGFQLSSQPMTCHPHRHLRLFHLKREHGKREMSASDSWKAQFQSGVAHDSMAIAPPMSAHC